MDNRSFDEAGYPGGTSVYAMVQTPLAHGSSAGVTWKQDLPTVPKETPSNPFALCAICFRLQSLPFDHGPLCPGFPLVFRHALRQAHNPLTF